MTSFRLLVITGLVFTVSTQLLAAEEQQSADQSQLTTSAQKFSYVLGLDIGGSLKELHTELDLQVLIKGLKRQPG